MERCRAIGVIDPLIYALKMFSFVSHRRCAQCVDALVDPVVEREKKNVKS